MADAQAPVEETTPDVAQEETPVETTEVEDIGTTPPETEVVETDRGDLRIPLQEERRKRQEYERQLAQLNDPAFIFAQAQKLGLAEGEYQAPAEQQAPAPDIASQVRFEIEVEKAKEKYPDVTTDPVLSEAAWSLVQKGHSPLAAADIVQKSLDKRMAKAIEEKVKSTINANAATESAKQNAELAGSTASSDTETADIERLQSIAKNWKDPKAQEAANLELLKMRMRR